MRCFGATWLVMKSEGAAAAENAQRHRGGCWGALLAVFAVISLWTPLAHTAIAARWFSLPNLYFLLPVPLLVILVSGWLWRTLHQRDRHVSPFTLTLGLVFLGFSGLGISIWPHIIPAGHHAVAGCRSPAKPGLYAGGRPADYSGSFLATPAGAITCSAAKFSPGRDITDALLPGLNVCCG
ncbi:Cytochrome bd2, subunit II [Klebsiella pneumoniae]|nr:Cytochrome bd2, subunit II [Klebsiella pneumoniae]